MNRDPSVILFLGSAIFITAKQGFHQKNQQIPHEIKEKALFLSLLGYWFRPYPSTLWWKPCSILTMHGKLNHQILEKTHDFVWFSAVNTLILFLANWSCTTHVLQFQLTWRFVADHWLSRLLSTGSSNDNSDTGRNVANYTSIVRVSEHFSKMLVLSGVFNTRILDTMNYKNQDYLHVNYTLIVIYSMLLVTGSQSKNISCFCLDMAQ
jgi:hypothetical protein